jgi:hypothetical protein
MVRMIVGKEERIDLAHERALRHVDLSQTDSGSTPGIKQQFQISRFYERAWSKPIQILCRCRVK